MQPTNWSQSDVRRLSRAVDSLGGQRAAAPVLGVCHSTLSRYLAGTQSPVNQCSVDWLRSKISQVSAQAIFPKPNQAESREKI